VTVCEVELVAARLTKCAVALPVVAPHAVPVCAPLSILTAIDPEEAVVMQYVFNVSQAMFRESWKVQDAPFPRWSRAFPLLWLGPSVPVETS
jgi:hypothetical protein